MPVKLCKATGLDDHQNMRKPIRESGFTSKGLVLGRRQAVRSSGQSRRARRCATISQEAVVSAGGGIMITASAAGLLSQIGSIPYSVTKHAAVGLAESLAITYGDQGIKVFALCPQAVRTAMTADTEGGVAAVDGMMEPDQLVDAVFEGLEKEAFLILPHPEVKQYMQRKTADYDRWLSGMRRLRTRYLAGAPLKKDE
jgi:NAD(P)-dependent dehydrogenase (short-subunit alcohol dehydrogenase family)